MFSYPLFRPAIEQRRAIQSNRLPPRILVILLDKGFESKHVHIRPGEIKLHHALVYARQSPGMIAQSAAQAGDGLPRTRIIAAVLRVLKGFRRPELLRDLPVRDRGIVP